MFATVPTMLEAVSLPFKRSQLGLFHGKMKQYGNNVPFSKKKTRRSWLPNVQSKRLESASLGEDLRLKVTTRALKTIEKHGGLDNYVLNTKAELLKLEGMRIRVMVREAQKRNVVIEQLTEAEAQTQALLQKLDSAQARKNYLTRQYPVGVHEKAWKRVWELQDRLEENEILIKTLRESVGAFSPPSSRSKIIMPPSATTMTESQMLSHAVDP